MIWGDFLLDNKYWYAQGATATHSGNPHYGNLAVHPAVGKISKNVVICDWHYEAGKSFPTLKHFSDAGYPVIACPWHLDENNTGITRAVAAIKQLGVLTTDWGFLVARAPGANSILGPVLGWNLSQPDGENRSWNADAVLAASLLLPERPSRRMGAKQIPLDLSPAATTPLSGDGSAWFEQGPGRDLTLLPRGHQNLFGTPYNIGPKAVVVDEKRPSAPALPVGRKVKSLIFLQGLMVEDLSVGARAYATYRVTRGDGSATNLRVNHRNAAHWFSLKPRKNEWGPWNYAHTWDALLAWEGITTRGDPINLQAWEWINPHPDEPVVSVELRLEPVDPGVKVGLVALTAVE